MKRRTTKTKAMQARRRDWRRWNALTGDFRSTLRSFLNVDPREIVRTYGNPRAGYEAVLIRFDVEAP